MENSSEFPQKLKTDLSSYSTPGYTSKENENRNSKMHMQKKKKANTPNMHLNIHTSIIYDSQDMEAT